MKKDYLKPEVVEMGVSCEVIATSNKIPVTPEEKPSLTGSSRGEWGNVWGK